LVEEAVQVSHRLERNGRGREGGGVSVRACQNREEPGRFVRVPWIATRRGPVDKLVAF